MQTDRERARRAILAEVGAPPETIDELLAYTANPFDPARLAGLTLPLPDEPHLEAWSDYAAEARDADAFSVLARRLVQLRFPIEAGISQTDEYRAATRRGQPPGRAAGLALRDPAGLSLRLHASAAGRVPILTVPDRDDFVALVRACSCRNEPDVVPDSMGACIVMGLNNWDRVERHRRRIEEGRGAPLSENEWAAEFRLLVPRKELYQDRFIILSCMPYSAVPAHDVGMREEEWLERSVAIRLEHECTHYFTLRGFGTMRNNLLDEFIADFAGLAHGLGRYDGSLFLRFMGLEHYPQVRPGGRLGIYLREPPLSPAAAHVAAGLVVRAAARLEAFAASLDVSDPGTRAGVIVALAGLTLEELAADNMGQSLAALRGRAASLDAPRTIG